MKSFTECPRLDVFKSVLVEGAYFSPMYELPLVQRTDFRPSEGIPFNISTRTKDYNQWLHFYEHDYQFEKVWKEPNRYLSHFKKFQGVITPDYSLYREMPLVMQMWNTYRNRALAYWLQNNGIDIIMNVRWGDERTYDFVFEGLAKGGTYAEQMAASNANLTAIISKKGWLRWLSCWNLIPSSTTVPKLKIFSSHTETKALK